MFTKSAEAPLIFAARHKVLIVIQLYERIYERALRFIWAPSIEHLLYHINTTTTTVRKYYRVGKKTRVQRELFRRMKKYRMPRCKCNWNRHKSRSETIVFFFGDTVFTMHLGICSCRVRLIN